MALLPLADGARLLGIHPKTLGRWLKEANMPLVAHPTDARVKCVMEQHLHQIARLHDRLLFSSALVPSQEPARTSGINEAESAPSASSLPSSVSGTDLIQKISWLETKVVTLQEQVAQLAVALLQERERSVEHRISVLESLLQQLVGSQIPDPPAEVASHESASAPRRLRQLLPAEQLARSRMPPLIEYSPSGTYIIVSSQEGELHLEPDSSAWFDWLASISSFRFVGPTGRFTACRERRESRGWIAHRSVHQRRFKRYIGVTDRLTIASLEQTAATLLTPQASF